jgi:hypothetical protein
VCVSITDPADIVGERLHSVIAITPGLPSSLGPIVIPCAFLMVLLE